MISFWIKAALSWLIVILYSLGEFLIGLVFSPIVGLLVWVSVEYPSRLRTRLYCQMSIVHSAWSRINETQSA